MRSDLKTGAVKVALAKSWPRVQLLPAYAATSKQRQPIYRQDAECAADRVGKQIPVKRERPIDQESRQEEEQDDAGVGEENRYLGPGEAAAEMRDDDHEDRQSAQRVEAGKFVWLGLVKHCDGAIRGRESFQQSAPLHPLGRASTRRAGDTPRRPPSRPR
jgi:hypothetical protein